MSRLRVLLACECSGRVRDESRTFPGIAKAFADQWGSYIENLEAP